MKIANCIFTNINEEEVKTLKVFYEDGNVEIITLNLDDSKVSSIVKECGGVDQITSNTRKYNADFEKEVLLFEKFKEQRSLYKDLVYIIDKQYTSEELFNLKIWLFEKPEVEKCKDRDLKMKLRTSKTLIDNIGNYLLIKESN